MKCLYHVGVLLTYILLAGVAPPAVYAADATSYFAKPVLIEHDGFRGVLARIAPRIYMSGQPSPEGLEALAELGVTTVINLRTQQEMDNREIVEFDEAAHLDAQGIHYVHIPAGGPDTPYAPAMVEQFAKALADALGNAEERVLLHCTVAWRASHLWAAYLVRHEGLDMNQALDIARQLNFGDVPLEGFLGEKLVLQTAEDN